MSLLNKFHKVRVLNDETIIININSVVGFRTICTDPVGVNKGKNYVVEALFILERVRVRNYPSSDDNIRFECIIMKKGTLKECEKYLNKLARKISRNDIIIWVITLTTPVLLSLGIINAKNIWKYITGLLELI